MNVHASTPHCEAAAQIVGPHSVLRSWAAFRTADQLFVELCISASSQARPISYSSARARGPTIWAALRPRRLGRISNHGSASCSNRESVAEPRSGHPPLSFFCPHCCTDISKKLDHNPYPEAGPPRVPVGPNSVPSPLPSCAKQSGLHMRRETALFLAPFGFID